jgi:hypothetical protein
VNKFELPNFRTLQRRFARKNHKISGGETFEKCFPLLARFKFKSKIPDFERGKAKILTTGIHGVF